MKPTEMVKLSAIAMGADEMGKPDKYGVTARIPGIGMCLWNPLKNDEQAMALLKRFGYRLFSPKTGTGNGKWAVECWDDFAHDKDAAAADLNRAIVECVAKLQKEKK